MLERVCIKNKISELDETDLRINIIIPLLKTLSCINILDNHGSAESGIDVYFEYKELPFGEFKYCGIVLKSGDIDTSKAREGMLQILEAMGSKFPSPTNCGEEHELSNTIFISNGVLKTQGLNIINKISRTVHLPIFTITIDKLTDMVRNSLDDINYQDDDFIPDKYKTACEEKSQIDKRAKLEFDGKIERLGLPINTAEGGGVIQ